MDHGLKTSSIGSASSRAHHGSVPPALRSPRFRGDARVIPADARAVREAMRSRRARVGDPIQPRTLHPSAEPRRPRSGPAHRHCCVHAQRHERGGCSRSRARHVPRPIPRAHVPLALGSARRRTWCGSSPTCTVSARIIAWVRRRSTRRRRAAPACSSAACRTASWS